MTPTIQLLLIATFAFICLTPGEAIECRMCLSPGPGSPCRPPLTCQIDPATHTCSARFFMINGQVQQKILGCKLKAVAACDTMDEAKGVRNACCENGDMCNESL